MESDARERAWSRVHDAIAAMPGWAEGPASWHGEVELLFVVAVDLRHRGRQATSEAITGTGATEIAVFDALATLLAARVSGR